MNWRGCFKSICLLAVVGVVPAALVACKSEAEKMYNQAKEMNDEGRLDEAIELYKKAAEADPNNAKARFRLAQVYEHQEKYPLAAEWYQKAIEADPDYVRSYAELVKALLRAKEFDKAQAAAKDALDRKVVRRDIEATQEIQALQADIEKERKGAATPPPLAAPVPLTPPPAVPDAATSPPAANP